MSLTNEIIQQTLSQQFTPKVENFHILHDMLAFEVKKEASFEVIKFLKEDPSMNFNFLTMFVVYITQITKKTASFV